MGDNLLSQVENTKVQTSTVAEHGHDVAGSVKYYLVHFWVTNKERQGWKTGLLNISCVFRDNWVYCVVSLAPRPSLSFPMLGRASSFKFVTLCYTGRLRLELSHRHYCRMLYGATHVKLSLFRKLNAGVAQHFPFRNANPKKCSTS